MSTLLRRDPEVAKAIGDEMVRQRRTINLIASENYASKAVLEAQGSVLTNKYAEGYPGRRYYGGCEFIDVAETIAIDRAKALFGVEHANVQPHSGAQANMAAYFALLKPGDTVMGLSLAHGGHLTHGSPVNFSSKLYNFVPYSVDRELELIDYDGLEKLAKEHRPKLIVTGATAYPRFFDFKRLREIADSVEAKLMADIAHIAGLIAAGEHPSPVSHAQVITSTTHKTLRGPRGGMILSDGDLAKAVDRGRVSQRPGRSARTRRRCEGRRLRGGDEAGVRRIPEVHPGELLDAGRRTGGRRAEAGIRRNGQPHGPGRRVPPRHYGQGGGGGAGPLQHRHKQERHTLRPSAPQGRQRHTHGHSGAHHTRHGHGGA